MRLYEIDQIVCRILIDGSLNKEKGQFHTHKKVYEEIIIGFSFLRRFVFFPELSKVDNFQHMPLIHH